MNQSKNDKNINGEQLVQKWINTFAKDDSELLKILKGCISLLPEYIGKLHKAIEAENPQEIHFQAHTIKGFSANVGMQEIYILSKKIDNESKNPNCNFNKIKKLFSGLQDLINSIPKKYFK